MREFIVEFIEFIVVIFCPGFYLLLSLFLPFLKGIVQFLTLIIFSCRKKVKII